MAAAYLQQRSAFKRAIGAIYRYGGRVIWPGDEWAFMDARGAPLTPRTFEQAFEFEEGLAAVKADGKWGFVDASGRIAIPATFDSVNSFSGGVAGARSGDKWGLIGRDGKWVVEPRFTELLSVGDGSLYAEDETGRGFIDKTGRFVRRTPYHGESSSLEGMAAISGASAPPPATQGDGAATQKTELHGFLEVATGRLIQPVYDAVGYFRNGLAPVSKDDKWGFIDRSGALVVPIQFDPPPDSDYPAGEFHFEQGLCAVGSDGKFGFVDRAGRWAIEAHFDVARQFDGPHALVVEGSTVGYIDRQGRWIWHADASEMVSKDPARRHDP